MDTPDIDILDEPAQPDGPTMRRILESREAGLERYRRQKARLLATPLAVPRRYPTFRMTASPSNTADAG
jgi:hypothetical protein